MRFSIIDDTRTGLARFLEVFQDYDAFARDKQERKLGTLAPLFDPEHLEQAIEFLVKAKDFPNFIPLEHFNAQAKNGGEGLPIIRHEQNDKTHMYKVELECDEQKFTKATVLKNALYAIGAVPNFSDNEAYASFLMFLNSSCKNNGNIEVQIRNFNLAAENFEVREFLEFREEYCQTPALEEELTYS